MYTSNGLLKFNKFKTIKNTLYIKIISVIRVA